MNWAELKKRKIADKELIIAIAQDIDEKKVLMTAFQDEEAFNKTQETKEMYFYSTSKNRLWKKGEKSGNTMAVEEVRVDCDGDALLYLVSPTGGSCHEGYDTCFYKTLDGEIVGEKVFDPKEAYQC